MSYIGISPYLYKNSVSTVDTFDDISGSFNGSTTTFNITVGGASYTRLTAKACLIVLGGIVQEAGVDYTVNAGQITFTTAPVAGLTFEGRHLFGLNAVDTPTLGSVYPATLSTGGPYWNTSGNVGIGTTNPTSKLTIGNSAVQEQPYIRLQRNATGGYWTGIQFAQGSTLTSVIQEDSNGTLRFVTGTNQLSMNITSTGNIGIGLTNPSYKLVVQSIEPSITSSATAPGATGAAGSGYFRTYDATNSYDTSAIRGLSNMPDKDGSLIFYTADNASLIERARITEGYFQFTAPAGKPGSVFKIGGTEVARIDSSGNVGIGTTVPAGILHCVGLKDSSNFIFSAPLTTVGGTPYQNYSELLFKNSISNNTSDASIRHYANIWDSSGSQLRLLTSNTSGTLTTAITINAQQNVGIGTTNPSSILQVNTSVADAQSTGTIIIQKPDFTSGSQNHNSIQIKNQTQGNGLNLGLYTDVGGNPGSFIDIPSSNLGLSFRIGGNDKVSLTSTGNVGIGTDNPSEKLHVVGTIRAYADTQNYKLYNIASGGYRGSVDVDGDGFGLTSRYNINGFINFKTITGGTLTERVRILNNGNVGIGTTNPNYTLDVYGTFRSRGTASTNRYVEINSVGRILSNLANNGNETNLILDNVGDATSNEGHGSNILWRTSDNTPSDAIDSGKLSIVKSETWTSNVNSRNSRFDLALAKNGTLETRLRVNSYSGGAGVVLYKRSANNGTDSRTAEHQYLFVEPDGDALGYYRRSLVSAYKGLANQYSYWAIRYNAASYDYTGSLKCRITWSTSHASGAGFAEFSLAVRSSVNTVYVPSPAGNIIQYGPVQSSNGWFYGWTVNPDFDVYYPNNTENFNYLILRLNGYGLHNGNTWDLGLHETVDLQSWGLAFEGIYKIGTSPPAGFTLNAVTKTILT